MRGKLIKLDPEMLAALEQLAKDKSGTFQEIADEAFSELLKKHNRPTTLLGALKESVKQPDETGHGVNKPKGDNARKGAVRKRTQLKGKTAWTKRSKTSGKFMDVKKGKKFKGVRSEKAD
jgi:hypothetical protein